jgi:hypothetical protein
MKGSHPLVLLDSAGGVGFLEFKTVLQILEGSSFFIILDDIHHLKHFRSYAHIKSDPSFMILGENLQHGWVVAKKNV